MSAVFDATPCALGEGPLWHPGRAALIWFDILDRRMYLRAGDSARHWQFVEHVSAAGLIDGDRLLLASETGLSIFDLDSGATRPLAAIEDDRPATRSNDGRADPQGGFWIGTMGKSAEAGAGAIYRWYRGELRRLFAGITIPNAICFAHDGGHAHFSDTRTRQVMRVRLDDDGWPAGAPEVFLDLTQEGLNPDGAVIDADGCLWVAQWGVGRVAAYGPDGRFLRAVAFGARQTSCPAFGGANLTTLYCTTAREGMDAAALAADPGAGRTFAVAGAGRGHPEHRVVP